MIKIRSLFSKGKSDAADASMADTAVADPLPEDPITDNSGSEEEPGIYIFRNDQQEGPFTAAELETEFAEGRLTREHFAWIPGQEDWKPLAELLQIETLDQPSDSIPA